MILKNKYLKHFIALIILASCSTTSKNIQIHSIESEERDPKDFQEIFGYQSYQEIFSYQSYSLSDLKTIQEMIESDVLNQKQLKMQNY